MLKKIFTLALALILIFSLAACGQTADPNDKETEAPSVTDAATETEAPAGQDDESNATKEPANGYALPLVEEETSISFWMPMQSAFAALAESYDDNYSIKLLQKQTGIDIDFVSVASDVKNEQFMIMASAGTMPDLLSDVGTNYTSGLTAACDDGVIINLTDYMEEYAPYYLKFIDKLGYAKDVVDDEGNFYHFATMSIQSRMAQIGLTVRGDWMRELGLEKVETYDDWYNYLTYAYNEYGAQMYMTNQCQQAYGYLASGFGTKMYISNTNYDTYMVKNGTVIYGPTLKDEAVEYLTMMNQWWNEGLIYNDFVTATTPFIVDTGLLLNNQVSAGTSVIGYWDVLPTQSDDENFQLWPAQDPVKVAGTTNELGETQQAAGTTEGISISTNCEQLEVCMKFLDFLYTDEGISICCNGELGTTYELDADGNPVYTEFMTNNEEFTLDQMKQLYISTLQVAKDRTIEYSAYDEARNQCLETWFMNGTSESYPKASTMTADESYEYSALYADIQTYASTEITRFIIGERSIDEYEDFIEELNDLGIERCVAIKQAAYERYIAR